MKQFKVTLAVVVLALGTLGVFAGKPAFVAGLYAKKAGSPAILIANAFSANLSNTSNGSQATISDHNGIAYPLYSNSTFAAGTELYELSAGW